MAKRSQQAEKRVVLVTGSGRPRVGNAVLRDLGQAGYATAVHYYSSEASARKTVAELDAAGVDAAAFQADVANEGDVDRMFAEVIERFGRLDVLVTTASIWSSHPLADITADEVRKSFNVNTLGTFLCARRAGLIMAEQETGGVIITFGDWAIERPYRDYAAYFAAKGAIPTLTRVLAVELGHLNPCVRVNCILPGPVMSPSGLTARELRARADSTLVKMADRPEVVSHAIRFLIENPFITGVCLPVDGGRLIA
jgi:pteridine reductase